MTGQPGRPPVLWRPHRGPDLICAHDGRHPGYLDETARRLSHEEYAVAARLSAEGHAVLALSTNRTGGRTPDLSVCGQGVEVKSWLPVSDRGGRPPTAKSVANKLIDASQQGRYCVLYARGSGLSAAGIEAGLHLYAQRASPSGLLGVRAMGDGYDLSWAATHRLERGLADRPLGRASQPAHRPAGRLPALGLW